VSVLEEIRDANDRYSADFEHGALPLPPARRFAVLTCMDARIDPARALGLVEGDAHVIRNAGGLASDDAVRSVVISQALLGTTEVLVIGHTDCGMVTFTNDQLREQLRDARGVDAEHLDFQPFPDASARVQSSVRRLRETPLLPDDYGVRGFVYDVATGRLLEVADSDD
jgi:carbonic anhydrase